MGKIDPPFADLSNPLVSLTWKPTHSMLVSLTWKPTHSILCGDNIVPVVQRAENCLKIDNGLFKSKDSLHTLVPTWM